MSIFLIFGSCICIVNTCDIYNRVLGLFMMFSKGEKYDAHIQGELSMNKNSIV